MATNDERKIPQGRLGRMARLAAMETLAAAGVPVTL